MTDIEHRLRQELKEQAERITPGQLRPLRAPRPGRRSRARRWLAPLAAMAAVVVVVAGIALSVGQLPSGSAPATRTPPAGFTGPSSQAAVDPPAFAGVLQSRTSLRQWIKLFSPFSGRILRPVAAFGDTLTSNGMALSPDSRFVYATFNGPRQIHIGRISVATGRLTFVADGAQPAVSPDGRYLAYATGRLSTRLAIRDLRTGRTKTVDLASVIGASSGLLTGQVTWLGGGAQIVAMPMPFGTALARQARSPSAAARNSCGQQGRPGRVCLVLVSLTGGHPRATRVYVPGNWGSQPLISGDVSLGRTLLLAGSLTSPGEIGAATISAAGVRVQRLAGLPRGVLPLAFAPGGDRILYLRGHGPPALWVAAIIGGRLSGQHRLFTDNHKDGFDQAAW